MVLIVKEENMKRITHTEFENKAKALKPQLIEKVNDKPHIIEVKHQKIKASHQFRKVEQLKKGDEVIYDFKNHLVGYLTLKIDYQGSPYDAPGYIKLNMAERLEEFDDDINDYCGWISKGWVQEEYIHIDEYPITLKLPRRYALRFLKISVIDTSQKYQLVIKGVSCTSVSAVDEANVEVIHDQKYQQIDRVAIHTLQNCMQEVFEDGPKRDRRLWLGDLYLQAKTNYVTFKNTDLVKRCLYLFATQTREDGLMSACIFTSPRLIADDTFIFEYSLLFISTLKDYYLYTNDKETLKDLLPIALHQIELATTFLNEFDQKGVLKYPPFIDWQDGLDKTICMFASYVMALNDGAEIYKVLNGEDDFYHQLITKGKETLEKTHQKYWDQKLKMYVVNGQVSYASQVYMILAGAVSLKQGQEILLNLDEKAVKLLTPYAHHYYVEALIKCGLNQEALVHIENYWGKMVELGADTFFEAFDPECLDASPYGGKIVNSYCHAWSCTPSYLLRKLLVSM